MRGLLVASVVALALSATKDFVPSLVGAPVWPAAVLGPYLAIGLFVSLCVCGGLGNLAWQFSEARGWHSFKHAAFAGAALGFIIVLAEIAILLPYAAQALEPGRAHALAFWLFGFVWTIITGACAGVAARAAAGPPSELAS